MADVELAIRRAGPVLAVVVLLGVVMVTAIMSGPQATRLPTPAGTPVARTPAAAPPVAPDVTATVTPPARPEATEAPTWLRVVLIVLGVLVALGLLVGIVQLARRFAGRTIVRRPAPPEIVTTTESLDAPEEEIRAAVDAGLIQLADDASDPRRAVIGCWLRLESAAAAAGTERRPDDTPGDLVARMLAARAASPEPLRELVELYRRARYAPADVDEAMRTAARATLTRLREELAAPAPAPSGSGIPAAPP